MYKTQLETRAAAESRFFYNSESFIAAGPHTPQTAHEFTDEFYEANRQLFASKNSAIAGKIITDGGEMMDLNDQRLLRRDSEIVEKHRLFLDLELPDPGFHGYAWYLTVTNMGDSREISRVYRLATHKLHFWRAGSKRLTNRQYDWDKQIFPEDPATLFGAVRYLATEKGVTEHIQKLKEGRANTAHEIAKLQARRRSLPDHASGPELQFFNVLTNIGFKPSVGRRWKDI
ncbi:MAG: hypothetical protein JWO35_882 [Candidatus Saccharibacteria bacterium]|nr:hypothetical protein [Candidatus Saccharibacteria bacterium]